MPDITQTSQAAVRLDGWDSIAHHLGVHKRTARAWHKERDLPVHQLFGKGGRVYAIGAELDEWRAQNDARLGLTGAPDGASSSERANNVAAEVPSRQTSFRQTSGNRTIPIIALAAAALLVMLTLRARSHMQLPVAPVPGRLLAKWTAEGGRGQSIPVGATPCNAVLTPDGALLFVANCHAETASVIATASGKVIREISVGPQPESLALDHDGKQLYVGNFWGGIGVFDVESGKPAGRIPLEGPISDIAVAPDDTLYVARREQGLAMISPTDRNVTRIAVTAMPMYLALSPDASRLYISYQGKVPGGREGHDAIDVYDTARRAFIARISGPPHVGGRMALSRSGLLLADGVDACFAERYRDYRAECPAAPGSVFSLIRTADARAIATLGYSGEAAGSIGVFPDGFRAITANQTLRVLDTAGLGVLEAFPMPDVRRVLFAPDGRKAWAIVEGPGEEPGSVAVLDTDRGSCAAPPRGLAGWWPGDGAADDARGAGNNGTLTGTVGYAKGLVGQAFHFDGSGSVSLGTLENLSTETPGFTAMAWVKFFDSASDEQALFDRLQSGPTFPGGFRLTRNPDGRIGFLAAVDSQTRAFATTRQAIPADTWTHVAAVRAADSISLYMNGVLAATAKLPGHGWNTPAGGEMRIGAFHDGGGALRGLVDEAQWYNRALDPGEIAAVVSARGSGVCER